MIRSPAGFDGDIRIKRYQDYYQASYGVMMLSAGQTVFTPLSLFAASEQGVWYDPSDLSTLFQDSAGTTPVTAVEQPVGRILDKSGRGNHAFQTTDINRPVLSARYNLLTETENFAAAAWTKTSVTVSATTTNAPFGGGTAALVTADAVSARHRVARTVASAGTNRFSVYVKAGGYDKVGFSEYATTGAYAAFSLSGAGSVLDSGLGASSPSIQALSGEWYLISFSVEGSASTGFAISILPSSYTTGSITGTWLANGTSGIYIWGAYLRVTNDGVGLPAYQRVTTATDYDTTGFPLYLRYNGTNSTMQTAAIDFSSTAQMAVFAGVRKLSDAAFAAIIELSADPNTNDGSFGLGYPRSGTVNAPNLAARGTSFVSTSSGSTAYPAPITSVLTGTADISGSLTGIRVNGSSLQSRTNSLGSGNFGNYALYLGARNAAGSWFQGRDYGIIVLGRTATATEIASTEAWLNGKTKAYA